MAGVSEAVGTWQRFWVVVMSITIGLGLNALMHDAAHGIFLSFVVDGALVSWNAWWVWVFVDRGELPG